MSNLAKIKVELQAAGLDALLLTDDISCRYVTDAELSEGTALITADKAYYFTDSRYIEVAERDIKGFVISQTNSESKLYTMISAILKPEMKVGFESGRTSVAAFDKLKEAVKADFVPDGGIVEKLRVSKQDYETLRMKEAQRITDEVLADALTIIKAGMTEKELAAEIIYRFYKFGADGLSFQPIVVSGPNSSLPHGVPTDRKLQNGDFITIDIGCLKDGYCSDMTRTVALGSATDEMALVYNTVLKAQLAGIAATKAGALGCDIDGAARKVIQDAGYGDYFGHGFGHSVGLEIHESPNPNPTNKSLMPEGAVITAEPGIYLPGKFGVRIEDMLIVTADGCTNITNSPKELIIL